MKVFLIKKDNALHPVYTNCREWFAKQKDGVILRAEVKKPRNAKHHALVHGLAKCVLINAPEHLAHFKYYTSHQFLKEVQMEIGHTEKRRKLNGDVYEVAKSMSFDSMSEDEFAPISDAMFELCARILKIEVDILRREYITFL